LTQNRSLRIGNDQGCGVTHKECLSLSNRHNIT
jgi:hypothetical protein